ncbi:DUF885 domain-containing protein [Amycolatopsis thermoflava]|uniref:DUF885 domain-containing protein n=1 Tax=Amycolatopsis thermoflava TaxID=84480 RepID=UPI003EBFA022
MPDPTTAVRDLADSHVAQACAADPQLGTMLGVAPGEDRLTDLSPAGQRERDELAAATLARLRGLEPGGDDERRCARLLRERLETGLAVSAAGEHLRMIRNILGPLQGLRNTFLMMPTDSAEDWAVIARRVARVPDALAGYAESLREGVRRGLFAAPRQVRTAIAQLDAWDGWFAGFTAGAGVPPALRADLDRACAAAQGAMTGLRGFLAVEYLPRAEGTPDGVGEERYLLHARHWTGAHLDLAATTEWAWAEYRALAAQMRAEAGRVLPGAPVLEAMAYLDREGPVVEGAEEVRRWLADLTARAMDDLDGRHFDLAPPVRVLETRLASPGSAAAPYYTRPARDFSRPGRTWLPTLGQTRFPLWTLISTWYHESVPGHHLQFGHWTTLSGRLSLFQTSAGSVSATTEGWALYAERLMDELGYLDDPAARLGYLDSQMMRIIRVIVDIGMHLGLPVPEEAGLGPGLRWTAETGRAFFGAHTTRESAFLDSEIVRYLGVPGQAISYKLGERAWLAGRAAARARNPRFELKTWHMAALSVGTLGLDDLEPELAAL